MNEPINATPGTPLPSGAPANPPATPAEPSGAGSPTAAPQTLSQEQINAIIERRIAETRDTMTRQLTEKYGDLDTLTKKAKELDDLKAAQLSDQERAMLEADTLKSKLAETEPKMARLTALEEFVTVHVTKRKEGLPVAITSLLDAMTDPLAVLKWLDEHAEEVRPPKPAPPNMGARDGNGNRQPGKAFELNKKVAL
jgi:hypothetical protein